jgi:hypothetical protein
MSAPQRIARASIGTFMALTCALGLGGFSAMSASAASARPAIHHGCPLGHRGHYPPGQCRIFFNRGSYHRGQTVRFETGKVFRTHERVAEKLTCRNGYHKFLGTDRAGSQGRVRDHFRLANNVPFGTCTLRLTGRHSGVRIRGSFQVVRKHHH